MESAGFFLKKGESKPTRKTDLRGHPHFFRNYYIPRVVFKKQKSRGPQRVFKWLVWDGKGLGGSLDDVDKRP